MGPVKHLVGDHQGVIARAAERPEVYLLVSPLVSFYPTAVVPEQPVVRHQTVQADTGAIYVLIRFSTI